MLATHGEEEIESGYQGTTHISFDATTSDSLGRRRPLLYRQMYAIVVRYLTLRVQHCSNRIFETRCLPHQ